MKGSQRRPFVPLKKPLHKNTQIQSFSPREITDLDVQYTHAFVDVMLPGNIPACLPVTSRGLSPEVWCIMGDCMCCALHHAQPPLLVQLQSRLIFAADTGEDPQHLDWRKMLEVADCSSLRYYSNHVHSNCIWCLFWYVINRHFELIYTLYILQFTFGAFIS